MSTIILAPELLAELEQRAERQGRDISSVVNDILKSALGPASPIDPPQSLQESLPPGEWHRQMLAAFDRLPNYRSEPLTDEAMSRDSIYD